ncbi:MAG: lactate utilization protein [Dehalococcoidia bacterium]|nr:lactate utilization protein [Dehalococcoidia bacterium]
MADRDTRAEVSWLYEKLGGTAVANLKRRGIDAWYVPTGVEARSMILEMIPEGASIGLGDSVTLEQLDVLPVLRSGNYRLFDRYRPHISPPEVKEKDDGLNKFRALTADVFLSSANAITVDGKLVSVDGVGTRVAPMVFGPKKVILAVGANKITHTVEDALKRIREIAAPMNARRHHHDVPCAHTGVCSDCRSPMRICHYTMIVDGVMEQDKGRINVVLIGEELGF